MPTNRMPNITKSDIELILKSINYPGYSRDIVSFGIVKDVQIENDSIQINLAFSSQNQQDREKLELDIKKVLSEKTSIKVIKIIMDTPPISQSNGMTGPRTLDGVKYIIAIASGKGGVGKSTVAINLAATLSKTFRVGVLDLDIYGPSLPIIIGTNIQPKLTKDRKLIPIEKFGMKFMSFGFINSENAPAIWRGPTVSKLTQQFFDDVLWGELDYLILDLPPGTGDIQLTLVQKLALTGAIIVTTPQDLALVDVKKGADMFKKVNTPVLGVVENMTHFLCPHCNESTEIFPGSGGSSESDRLNVPLLGRIYLSPDIARASDQGVPFVFKYPDSEITQIYANMTAKLCELVSV